MIRDSVAWLAAHPRLTALLGAISISFSGILYRLSESSPETAAFFRMVYALPILMLDGMMPSGIVIPLSSR